jgi:hypothetical protein
MTPTLAPAFQIKLMLGSRVFSEAMPDGRKRGFVGVLGGEITGPRLQGRVLPHSGGDWPSVRPDGVFDFSARYLLEAGDGTIIYMKNRGYRHGPPEVIAELLAYKPVDPSLYYMRLAPEFEVPSGPHDWMGRTVFVGTGNRREDHSIFTYWTVE